MSTANMHYRMHLGVLVLCHAVITTVSGLVQRPVDTAVDSHHLPVVKALSPIQNLIPRSGESMFPADSLQSRQEKGTFPGETAAGDHLRANVTLESPNGSASSSRFTLLKVVGIPVLAVAVVGSLAYLFYNRASARRTSISGAQSVVAL